MTEQETNVNTDEDHDHLIDSVRNAVAAIGGVTADDHVAAAPEQSAAVEIGNEIAEQIGADQDRTAGVPNETRTRADPPTSWSAEAKAEFAKLSPHVQEAVLKREREVSDGFKHYSDKTKSYGELESVIAPRREHWKAEGYQSDAHAINTLFAVSDAFMKDRVGTVEMLFSQQPLQRQEAQRLINVIARQSGLTASDMHGLPSREQLQKEIEQYANARAEQIAQAKFEQFKREQAKVQQKVRAANASLNGAPYGLNTSAPVKRSNAPAGSHADIADDIRAAISLHS